MRHLASLKQTTIALAITQALIINVSSAATITVTNEQDANIGCTFREAIETINAGSSQANGCIIDASNGTLGNNDTIQFEEQITEISIIENQIDIDSDVSINLDSNRVTLSGDNSSGLLSVVDGATVEIDNMVLTNGAAAGNGGAISVFGSNLTLTNSVITSNTSSNAFGGSGGAIGVFSLGTLTLTNCIVSDNYSRDDGGGVRITSSTAAINNSTISGNSADQGGGLFINGGSTVVVNNSTIFDNSVSDSEASGGGVFISSSDVTFNNSTISANNANSGGGIFVRSGAAVNLNNITVSGNSTLGAGNAGGGVALIDISTVNINNSIISGNEAARGAELSAGTTLSTSTTNTINTTGNNIVGNSSLTTTQAISGLTPDTNNIINVNGGINFIATSNGNTPTSLENILAPLADNGGATQTHALVTDSPAIDAGDNALCSDGAINSFDQRGVSRPQGSACDIGSFEVIVNEEVGIEEATFFTIPLPNGKSATFGL